MQTNWLVPILLLLQSRRGDLPKELEFFGLQPEVEVVGRVPDIRPYLHRASCLVVPLRFGGGLRIRVLEAMAAGLPVVASSVAMAGMPFEAGSEYLLADKPQEYAAHIRHLMEDEQAGPDLARNALKRVRGAYGAESQARRAVEMVRRRIRAS